MLTGISYFAVVGLSGVNNVHNDALLNKFDIGLPIKEKIIISYYNGYVSIREETSVMAKKKVVFKDFF